MEYKIEIPDGYELVKTDSGYAVRKKDNEKPPRSWAEFCENYPLKNDCFIRNNSTIESAKALGIVGDCRHVIEGVNWITSKEEAEAFLALMQLRQLRKAWIGDWEQPSSRTFIAAIAYNINDKEVVVEAGNYWSNMILSFPTRAMATDFLECFIDLLEKAKTLL